MRDLRFEVPPGDALIHFLSKVSFGPMTIRYNGLSTLFAGHPASRKRASFSSI